MEIENAIKDVNTIMRSKVVAIGGNCILGYNVQVINLKEEYYYNSQAVFLAVTAIGDAVELAVYDTKVSEEDNYSLEMS